MEAQQRVHLMSTYLTVIDLIREMEAIARNGRAAAAPGAVLTPLPDEWWRRMAAPLAAIRELLRDLVARDAPEELREHEAAQPLAATTRWLSVLLLRLGEEVEGLEPERLQRQYGELPEAAARDLAALQGTLARELARARDELNRPAGGGR